jgi:hypothetical protein
MSQRSTGKPCTKIGPQVSVANARYTPPKTHLSAPHPPVTGSVRSTADKHSTVKGGPGPTKNHKTPKIRTVSARITGANDMSQLEKFRRSMSKDL